ncbi:MAG: DUF4430 domain-containing protein [Streptococcaceae bacterium]|jgi:hypothetical protein|nr:DUF4430 domain-containing protein [Streptococcaceae bacterium]
MKHWKKLVTLLAMVAALFIFTGCTNSNAEQIAEDEKINVQIVIEDKTHDFEIYPNTTLLELVTKELDAKDEDGFVTSVGTLESDPSTNTWLLFNKNGEMATVGAQDLILKDGDIIEFYLEQF